MACVYGMNVIVNQSTHVTRMIVLFAVMLAMSGLPLH
jgi:hypothetical protein